MPWFVERWERLKQYRLGPSRKDLTAWELRLARSLGGSPDGQTLIARLQCHFFQGIVMRHNFAGMDCTREAMQRAADGLCAVYGMKLTHQYMHAFQVLVTILFICMYFLYAYFSVYASFGDYLLRVHPEIRVNIEAIIRLQDVSERQHRFTALQTYVQDKLFVEICAIIVGSTVVSCFGTFIMF